MREFCVSPKGMGRSGQRIILLKCVLNFPGSAAHGMTAMTTVVLGRELWRSPIQPIIDHDNHNIFIIIIFITRVKRGLT